MTFQSDRPSARVRPAGRGTGTMGAMPTVLRDGFVRFFCCSNGCSEPPHVYIEHGDALAKFWLEPVALAANCRFRGADLRRHEEQVRHHQQRFLEAWHECFSSAC